MTQYIDKYALAAEIEKYYNECLKRAKITDPDYWNTKADAYRNVLAILDDTLEVKEVNLPTWEPICSFQYFSDNDIFIEDNCLRWGNMVISLDELKKLPKKS